MIQTLDKCLKLVRINISVQPVRNRAINTKRPRKPHFEKACHLAIAQPIYPKPCDFYFPNHLKCRIPIEKKRRAAIYEEENPYQRLLSLKVKNWLDESKQILFVHKNYFSGYDEYDIRYLFHHQNMKYDVYGKSTVKLAVKGTKYEQILCLFTGGTAIVCSPEVNLNILPKLLKKMPGIVLLAGIVEDKFFSAQQLMELSKFDLQTARAQLVSSLNLISMKLSSNLTQHQQTLVSYLEQYTQINNLENNEKCENVDTNENN